MKLRPADNKIISFLLVALLVQVVVLIWHMGWFGKTSTSQKEQGEIAGYIEILENNLKRRPINNLIWEASNEKDKVYFLDSLLTLNNSSAKLKLENGTEIKLAANTLITIEPIDIRKPDEIRIQFSKGQLQARNPFKRSTLKDEKMSLVLEKSSAVDLSKNDQGEYEIVVKKGKATLNTLGQNQTINENQIYFLDSELKAKKANISSTIKWAVKNKIRTYTHQEKATVKLDWMGSPQKIVIQKKGNQFKTIELSSIEKSIILDLPIGTYRAYLSTNNEQSKRITIEVRKAPLIHLVSPRPRDRAVLGTQKFIWEQSPVELSFEIHFQGRNIDKKLKSDNYYIDFNFDKEDDIHWSVWGIDKEGFKIPPPYTYPLYIRENLFAPPKLKNDAHTKGALNQLLHWIFPQAHAQITEQALLTWNPVPNADLYVIEISQSIDFRKLSHRTQTNQLSYVWEEADPQLKYYWRVAAGNSQGQMGSFSEPTPLQWSAPPSKSVKKIKPIKKKKQKFANTQKKASPPSKSESPHKEESVDLSTQVTIPQTRDNLEEDSSSEQSPPLIKSIYIALTPFYSFKSYQSPLNTNTKIQGLSPVSVDIQAHLYWNQNFTINLLTKYAQSQYKPKLKNQNPFQKDIQTSYLKLLALMKSNKNQWGIGVMTADIPFSARKDFEEIQINQSVTYGIIGSYNAKIFNFDYWGILGPNMVSSQVGLYTSHRLLHSLFWEELKTGVEVESYFFGASDTKANLINFSFQIGWEF